MDDAILLTKYLWITYFIWRSIQGSRVHYHILHVLLSPGKWGEKVMRKKKKKGEKKIFGRYHYPQSHISNPYCWRNLRDPIPIDHPAKWKEEKWEWNLNLCSEIRINWSKKHTWAASFFVSLFVSALDSSSGSLLSLSWIWDSSSSSSCPTSKRTVKECAGYA